MRAHEMLPCGLGRFAHLGPSRPLRNGAHRSVVPQRPFTVESPSVAPNPRSVAFWASVNPCTCEMFMRSYGLSPINVLRQSKVWTSQNLMVPSSLLVARVCPPGLKATHLTRLACPRMVRRQSPVLTSHRRIV